MLFLPRPTTGIAKTILAPLEHDRRATILLSAFFSIAAAAAALRLAACASLRRRGPIQARREINAESTLVDG